MKKIFKTEKHKEYLSRLSSLKTFNVIHKTYTEKTDNKMYYVIEYSYKKHKVKLFDISESKQIARCECGLNFVCSSEKPICKCGKKYNYFYDSGKSRNVLTTCKTELK